MRLNQLNLKIAQHAFNEDDKAPESMKGIEVSPERTAVTDGSIIVIVSGCEIDEAGLFEQFEDIDPADHWTSFILPKATALRLAKAMPRKKAKLPAANYAVVHTSTEDNTRATISVNDKNFQDIHRADKIEDQFPAVDSLIENAGPSKFSFFVEASALREVAQALTAFTKYHKGVAGMVTVAVHPKGNLVSFSMDAGTQSIRAYLMGKVADDAREEGK